MNIDFHDKRNRYSYVARSADLDWMNFFRQRVNFAGKRAADIGSGGGIYSIALAQLGAAAVNGVDFSREMVCAAAENCGHYPQIRFKQGSAEQTGLADASVDVVLQRALIHHLQEPKACFHEAWRILAPGGTLILQDRTPEDCLLPGSGEHLRGYFFEAFPRLSGKETARRHESAEVKNALADTGFGRIKEEKLWEVRKSYETADLLADDLRKRTGRSLFHELNDEELAELIRYVLSKIPTEQGNPIVERDRWTVWLAEKD